MTGARTTIVVSQRECYTPTVRYLEPILEHAGAEARGIVVDGGSPEPIRAWLDGAAARHDLLLLRVDHCLAPSEARAAALPFLESEFVAFVDNDVTMSDGWLATLERTADETGAWAVGPLYLHGFPTGSFETPRIHMAGGRCQIIEVDGRRRIDADMDRYDVPADTAWPAERFPTQQLEYHCMLVRTAVIREPRMHDAALLSGHDMYDLCLRIADRGGECWLEPAASAFYERPRRIDALDRDLYFLRWSTVWDMKTLDHFTATWELDPDDPDRPHTRYWHAHQRRLGYVSVDSFGGWWRRKRRALADAGCEADAVARDRDRRRAAGAPPDGAAEARVAHAPTWLPASAERLATY